MTSLQLRFGRRVLSALAVLLVMSALVAAQDYRAKVQGVVIIEATIDTNGFVSSARVLRSIPMLDQAALDAVKEWQFQPTQLNGVAVPVIMTVTVNFTMQ